MKLELVKMSTNPFMLVAPDIFTPDVIAHLELEGFKIRVSDYVSYKKADYPKCFYKACGKTSDDAHIFININLTGIFVDIQDDVTEGFEYFSILFKNVSGEEICDHSDIFAYAYRMAVLKLHRIREIR